MNFAVARLCAEGTRFHQCIVLILLMALRVEELFRLEFDVSRYGYVGSRNKIFISSLSTDSSLCLILDRRQK